MLHSSRLHSWRLLFSSLSKDNILQVAFSYSGASFQEKTIICLASTCLLPTLRIACEEEAPTPQVLLGDCILAAAQSVSVGSHVGS